jgi:hypothetical protein
MNRAYSNNTGPAAVDKYLLPRETREAMTRRHPAVLISPSAQAVGGLLVAAVLSATLLRGDGHATLRAIVWVLWGLLLLRLVWDAVNWYVDYFVVTSQRILLTSGIFTRSVAMMPLAKVTDMSFHRTFAGRLLGYGEFVVESAGQDQALRKIDHIPYPEQLYLIVCGKIFKDAAGQDDGTGDIGPVSDEPIPDVGPLPSDAPGAQEDQALNRSSADTIIIERSDLADDETDEP